MATFPYNDLPAELRSTLLRSFDPSTLSTVCRLNKKIFAEATPLLWGRIDFKTPDFDIRRWRLEGMLQSFFLTCYSLQETRPQRWQELAAYVQCIRLVKVPDMQLGYWAEQAASFGNPEDSWHDEWPFPTSPDRSHYRPQETVWDTICYFRNLQELHIYVQQRWEYEIRVEELARKLQGALPLLKRLKIGGDVTQEMMLALLSSANQSIEELSCIALQDGTVGQDYHSRGLLFLAKVSSMKSFLSLRALHLCKLAELSQRRPDDDDPDGRYNDDSGLPWQWEHSDDLNTLNDWAEFIKRNSDTLQSLTLEDRYLVSAHKFRILPPVINPGGRYPNVPEPKSNRRCGDSVDDDRCNSEDEDRCNSEDEDCSDSEDEEQQFSHPLNWGAASRLRFRQTLLPVLSEQAWPRLKKLVLIGLALSGSGSKEVEEHGQNTDDDNVAQLDHFLNRLSSNHTEIELRPAGFMPFHNDATPMNVSPCGSWHAGMGYE